MSDIDKKLDKISLVLDKVLSEQAQIKKAQQDGSSEHTGIHREISKMTDEQTAMWGDVRRVEVLLEAMHDDDAKLAEAIKLQSEHIAALPTNDDLEEIKTDIKTIKAAVRATNQDLHKTKKIFGHLKTA